MGTREVAMILAGAQFSRKTKAIVLCCRKIYEYTNVPCAWVVIMNEGKQQNQRDQCSTPTGTYW